MKPRIRTFKDLAVWQKAFELCLAVYKATRSFPADERYGLAVELRKTARSVACNIAEGHRRKSTIEYIRFLDIAFGSVAELETQLLLAAELGYLVPSDPLFELHGDVDRMLPALMRALEHRKASS